ncbi:MAG: TM0106 family RecB-like putative nuclease, partial [Acidimicrobiales bacterium]
MHLLEGRPVLSASDLVGFLACEHLTQLELAALRGEVVRPIRDDPELDVLARRGEEHERRHLAELAAAGAWVVECDAPGGNDRAALVAAEGATLQAMRSGAAVIYQAAFFDGTWRGQADFLHRVEEPSLLGSWRYEPADTKLARRVKAAAVLQLCSYADHLTRLQGVAPQSIHVVTGDGRWAGMALADFAAYYRVAKGRAEEAAWAPARPSYPDPVAHCGVCRWAEACQSQRRGDDHLSLVAGMRRSQTAKLVAAGVTTLAGLATLPETAMPRGIAALARQRLRRQAALQLGQRASGQRRHELIEPVEAGRGLCLLPPPSPGDLFFDIEGDPFAGDDGLEYLLGV